MKPNQTPALAALLAGSLFAVTVLRAEEPTAPPKRIKPDAGHREVIGVPPSAIFEKLGLSDEQKAKLKAATEDTQKQSKALREDTTMKRQDKMAKLAELSKAHKAKVKEILTPEQFEKYQKYEEEHRPIRPDNRVRGPNVG